MKPCVGSRARPTNGMEWPKSGPLARWRTRSWRAGIDRAMSSVPHLPALRKGQPYESLDKVEVKDHRTGEVLAVVSQVNAGIIRRDLNRMAEVRYSLRGFTVEKLIEISAKAGDLFL